MWQLEPATLAVAAVSLGLLVTPPDGAPPEAGWLGAGLAWALAALVRAELLLALPVIAVRRPGGRAPRGGAGARPGAGARRPVHGRQRRRGLVGRLHHRARREPVAGQRSGRRRRRPFQPARERCAARRPGDAADAATANRRLGAAALRLFAHPAATARLAVRKLLWTVHDRELPNSADIDGSAAWRAVRRAGAGGPRRAAPGGAGRLGAARRAPPRRAASAGADRRGAHRCVVLFTNARFRLVAAPPLAVLARLAFVGLSEVRGPPVDRRRALWAAAAALAGVALTRHDLGGIRAYRIGAIEQNTASLELREGRVDQALARLQRAVAATPDDPGAWTALAGALAAARRPEARAAWREAARRFPDDPAVRAGAARFLGSRAP
ncbi:MAG: tetratricopeptide repeat protein [Myxococcota bacterium]